MAFTGTLGDNTPRTYSRGISYAPGGQMTQERLGTTTAIYNKLFYNSRGQLAEIREGLSANNDSSERGAIVNFYSDHCWGMCTPTQQNDGSMPDNNGNLLKQEIDVPDSDHFSVQWFVYDSLNRLHSANEVDYYSGSQQEQWRQTYIYDRFGNRTIDQNSANTFGDGIPKPNFRVLTASNRLGVPHGYSGTMHYDSAGNLDQDTYSAAAVSRLYDAENRMTKETQASSYVAGEYSYDGDGRRVKRKVGNVETWQVYGLGGELLAEYAANTSYTTPQKEYGYRNGQLLVTVTCGSGYGDPPVLHDNPLVVGETTVQARHITELRTAISALRARAGMAAYSWTTSATTSDWISAAPIAEMRTALNQVLGPPPSGYSSGLASELPIKAIHIQELRDRLTTAWGIDIRWLVTDQLGTPRMVFDQSGSLSGVSRHDYLPFGEELFAGTGGRTTTQGYSLGDGARQKFTSKERDGEAGVDYSIHRYYASLLGRFTSVDPTLQSVNGLNPQTLNRYSYVLNDPLKLIDPFGLWGLSYSEVWENGKYARTQVTITKTGKSDDANSLLVQLGYDPKSKEGQQLLTEISSQLKDGEAVDPTKLSGIVGRLFSTYEEKFSDQVRHNLKHPYKPDTQANGPRDSYYADCSMTALRVALPQQMQQYGGMTGRDFDVQEASNMLEQIPTPKDGLRAGDVIRYGREEKTHFLNVLFTDDDGTTQAFSRTGVQGPFESLRIDDPKLTQGYGKVTGQYRPPFGQ